MTNPLGRSVASPRALGAWALLGYVALFLFFAFFRWILPGGSFSGRSAGAEFRSLFEMAMPLVAVLLAVYVNPPLPGARIMAGIAVVEYAISLFFGLVTLLIGLGAVLDGVNNPHDMMNALAYLVLGAASLVLIAIAGYVCLRAFLGAGGLRPTGRPTTPAA